MHSRNFLSFSKLQKLQMPSTYLQRPLALHFGATCRRMAFTMGVEWPRGTPSLQRRSTATGAKLSKGMREIARLQQAKEEARIGERSKVRKSLSWEKPLYVRKYPDPCLRAPNATITSFDKKLARLAKEMLACMYQDNGIGLAAPQVGVNARVMVFSETGVHGEGKEYVLVNPTIVEHSAEEVDFEEGCLSFPQLYAFVRRPVAVRVAACDARGNPFEFSLDGLAARVFQHEYDHLQGTLFIDRISRESLDAIGQGLIDQIQDFEKGNPGIDPAL